MKQVGSRPRVCHFLVERKAQVALYPEPLRDAILRRFMPEAAFLPDYPRTT